MKVNVLYISHVSSLYGANKSLLNLVSGLRGNVNFHVLIPREGEICKELAKLDVNYSIIKYGTNSALIDKSYQSYILYIIRFFVYPIINLLAIQRVTNLIKRENIQLVHSNSSTISFGLKIAKKHHLKHVWHIREYIDIGCNLYPFKGMKSLRNELKKSDSIIYISKGLAEYYNLLEKSTVIYNGVQKEDVETHLDTHKENFFLFCGALDENKGIIEAIEVFAEFAKYNDFKLLVVGSAISENYQMHLNNIVNSLKMEKRILFLGFQHNVRDYMSKANALLMCTRHEGMGRTTVEAMLSFCPVIGYNGSGTKELIRNNETGFLYSTKDQLLNCMNSTRVFNGDILNITENAYHFAKQNFTEEIYANKVLDVYHSLIGLEK